MPARAADLPDPVVGLHPALLDELHHLELQSPRRIVDRVLAKRRHVHRRHHLAVDVELKLAGRCVSDAHGARFLVSGKPGNLPLVEASLTRRAVHDLEVGRVAGRRAKQPVPPCHRLLVITTPHQAIRA